MCPAENFDCTGMVNFTILALLSEAFSEFRNTERQSAAENLSNNIAKRWRVDETLARMESV